MGHKILVSSEDWDEATNPDYPEESSKIEDQSGFGFEMTEADWHDFERDFEIAVNMMEIGCKTGRSGLGLYRQAEQMYNDEHGVHHRL